MYDSAASDSDNEEQGFFETVQENRYLGSIFRRCGSVEAFLRRSETIYVRSTTVDDNEQSVILKSSTDVDGCVLELKDLSSIQFPVRHLTLLEKGIKSLASLKPLLGKHLDLRKFSTSEMTNFNRSLGFQLFYERGWECYVGLIPRLKGSRVALNQDVIQRKCLECFTSLKAMYSRKLLSFCDRNVACRGTLMKNDLCNIGKLFILPDDSKAMLRGLQEVVADYKDPEFRLILFCFRFGEKMGGGLSLGGFDLELIQSVTVHAALDIRADSRISLFWSMSGLQEMVGDRGLLRTCLSFRDCGTFQSNLDGKGIDVGSELRGLCSASGELRFLQLYADVPHRRPKTRFHPVSGTIAGGKCFPTQSAQAYKSHAEEYIAALGSNWRLFRDSSCRMEFVMELKCVGELILAEECIDTAAVFHLLEKKPLLVPVPFDSITCVREVGTWLTQQLGELYTDYQGTGNVGAVWRAYQIELALEKVLWGQPRCHRSTLNSINLGPGTLGPSRSSTDRLGFLALDASTSCMRSEETIPPCLIWTQSTVVGKRIERFVGLHDYIHGSLAVLGKRLILALLHDLYDVGKMGTFMRLGDFISGLKEADSRLLQVVGAIPAAELVRVLSSQRRVSFPMVYGHLYHLVKKADLPVLDVLEAGMAELKLEKFPALDLNDKDRHPIIRWTWRKKFWKVVDLRQGLGMSERSALEVTALVKSDLERRGLVYMSKLKKAPLELPWIKPCVRRLDHFKLGPQNLVTTLSFISCVALLMQGWYVDYDRIASALSGLPVKLARLQGCEIFSKFTLKQFVGFKLYRLHPEIPHKLDVLPEAAKPSGSNQGEENEEETEKEEEMKDLERGRFPQDECGDEGVVVERREVSCLPVSVRSYTRWSPLELQLLGRVYLGQANKSLVELYDAYRDESLTSGLPFRTFRAFKDRALKLSK